MRINTLAQLNVLLKRFCNLMPNKAMQAINADARSTLVRITVVVTYMIKEIAVVKNADAN
jgi:hypothetical protein